MHEEHYWAVIILSAILAYFLIKAFSRVVDRHFVEKRRVAEREILQKERLLAMEKGLPLPEWDKDLLASDLDDAVNGKRPSELQVFRTIALGIGLLLVFGGIGLMLALALTGADWPMGLVLVMSGIGLLLFYTLTRERHT